MFFIYRIILLIVILIYCSCDISQTTHDNREIYFTQSSDDLHVAIVSSSNMQNDFLEGVNIAIDKLNSYRVLGNYGILHYSVNTFIKVY
jgi:hypothetical protein